MVFPQPVHRTGDEEALHFRLAVVKDQGAPLLVFALSGVLILVARCAVEEGKSCGVSGEVGRDPVHDYADSRLVAAVHKAHKVLGFAIAGGGGKVPRHLIAPGTVIGVLGQGHKFDVGETHVLDVGDQLVAQLVIREYAAVSIFTPGTCVHLIDVHGLLVVGVFLLMGKPLLVMPFIALNLIPAGGSAGTGFRMPRKGVGFVGILAMDGFNIELVHFEGLKDKVGEALPHSVVDLFQGVFGLVPVAEIAHQRDLSGVGRPHPGYHALFALMGGLVQAQVLIGPAVFSASE